MPRRPHVVVVLAAGAVAAIAAAPASQQAHRVVLTKAGFGATVSQSEFVVHPPALLRLVQFHRVDTATSTDPAFRHVEEHVFGQAEVRGEASHYRGHSVWILPNGDRLHISWSGAAIPTEAKSPDTVVDSGTIVVTGGAGRYARARGGGTYQGFPAGTIRERIVLDLRF